MSFPLLKDDSSRHMALGLNGLANNAPSSSSSSNQLNQCGLVRTIQWNYKDKLIDVKLFLHRKNISQWLNRKQTRAAYFRAMVDTRMRLWVLEC